MGLDFQNINDRKVGYIIRGKENPSATGPSTVFELKALTFREFIPPYSSGMTSYQQVYDNLDKALDSAIDQQDTVTDGKRSVMLDVLATATLQREAMSNSMDLILSQYL